MGLGPEFFEKRQTAAWAKSYEAIAETLVAVFHCRTVLDVGCATGELLVALKALGVRASGVDAAPEARVYARPAAAELMRLGDATRKSSWTECNGVDVIVCLEVAEHIPRRRGPLLIARLCQAGETIVFSAAPPGQGGSGHVNERPWAYWQNLFRRNGADEDVSCTALVRQQFEMRGALWWYAANTRVLRRRIGCVR